MGKKDEEQFSPIVRAVITFIILMLVAVAIMWVGK